MQKSNQTEKNIGIILLLCSVAAIVICNSPLKHWYDHLLDIPMTFQIGTLKLQKPIILWVNEGLMAIFFLFVTLEIKKEMLTGSLNTNMKRAFPFIAAIGGMIVPACLYLYIIAGNHELISGWAIPTATDIVFSISLLAIIGAQSNHNVRSFLLALAIFDDVGAILIIAIYYTNAISLLSIISMIIAGILLFTLNRLQVKSLAAYVLVGIFLWLSVLKSGVHATLAGIAIALALPSTAPKNKKSMAKRVKRSLEPWVHYLILPVFAFTNSGVSFLNVSFHQVFTAMPVAIIVGLFFGKQIGITLFSYLGTKLKLAHIPRGLSWREVYGVSILCGIGFTMSLFIGALAFEDMVGNYATMVRAGVMAGSLLSAIFATIYFKSFVYGKNK